MKLISIIIPVFNTSQYLDKCISSCLNQDIERNTYEIIIVDDGSTDDSAEIIIEFEKNYSNIVFLQKENGGVSSARNLGISVAKGEYIFFVDSDDTIKLNTLNFILNRLKKIQNEITILNSVILTTNNKKKEVYSFPDNLKNKKLTGEELFMNKFRRGSVCGVVFRKDFLNLNNLQFPELVKNGEDAIFMTFCFISAKSIQHLNIDFYEVHMRANSASRSWNLHKIIDMLASLNVLDMYLKNNILTRIQKAMIYIKAYGIISNALFHFFSLNQLSKYHEIRAIVKNNNLYPIKTCGVNHFRFKIILLNFSVDLFCLPFLIRQQYFNLIRYIKLAH